MHFPGHHQNLVRSDITATPESDLTARFRSTRRTRGASMSSPDSTSRLYRSIKAICAGEVLSLVFARIEFLSI